MKLTGKSRLQYSKMKHIPDWLTDSQTMARQLVMEIDSTAITKLDKFQSLIKKYLADFEETYSNLVIYQVVQIQTSEKITVRLSFFPCFTYKKPSFIRRSLADILIELGFNRKEPILQWKKCESQKLVRLLEEASSYSSQAVTSLQVENNQQLKDEDQQAQIPENGNAISREVIVVSQVELLLEGLERELEETLLEAAHQQKRNQELEIIYQKLEYQVEEMNLVLPDILMRFKLAPKSKEQANQNELSQLLEKIKTLEKRNDYIKSKLTKTDILMKQAANPTAKSQKDKYLLAELSLELKAVNPKKLELNQQFREIEAQSRKSQQNYEQRLKLLQERQAALVFEKSTLQQKLVKQEKKLAKIQQTTDSWSKKLEKTDDRRFSNMDISFVENQGELRSAVSSRSRRSSWHKVALEEYKHLIRIVGYLEFTWSIYQQTWQSISDKATPTKEINGVVQQIKEEEIQNFIFNHRLQEIQSRTIIKQLPLFGRSTAVFSKEDFQICTIMEEQYHLMQKAIRLLTKVS